MLTEGGNAFEPPKEDIKMKRSIFTALAVAAVLSCTACGSTEVGTAEPPAVTASGTKEQATTTAANDTVSAEPSTEIAQTTTDESIAAVSDTAVTSEALPAGGGEAEPVTTQPQTQAQTRSRDTAPSPGDADYAPAPVQYDIPGITYIQGTLIANKSYSLPADFNPGLDSTCENQFYKLQNDAAQQGLNIWFASGFRSYDYQAQIYNNYVARDGQALADTYSARPGYSEHQSGLAIDVNQIDDSFIGTPEAVWLENHCHEYGFILRYPRGKESITGYQYESWHIRYVGTDLSYAVHDSGLTLEEYFGIDSSYKE
jgi:D-alanyl-D-alanine carboxypeptidase